MTKTQVNIQLDDAQIETLDRMAGEALTRQSVARMLVIAALQAVERNGNLVHLPPKFRVDDGSAIQEEPQSAKSTTRGLPETGKTGRAGSRATRALMGTLPKPPPGGSK